MYLLPCPRSGGVALIGEVDDGPGQVEKPGRGGQVGVALHDGPAVFLEAVDGRVARNHADNLGVHLVGELLHPLNLVGHVPAVEDQPAQLGVIAVREICAGPG